MSEWLQLKSAFVGSSRITVLKFFSVILFICLLSFYFFFFVLFLHFYICQPILFFRFVFYLSCTYTDLVYLSFFLCLIYGLFLCVSCFVRYFFCLIFCYSMLCFFLFLCLCFCLFFCESKLVELLQFLHLYFSPAVGFWSDNKTKN